MSFLKLINKKYSNYDIDLECFERLSKKYRMSKNEEKKILDDMIDFDDEFIRLNNIIIDEKGVLKQILKTNKRLLQIQTFYLILYILLLIISTIIWLSWRLRLQSELGKEFIGESVDLNIDTLFFGLK